MKQKLFIFLFLISRNFAFGQTPQTPELCLVTVDNNANPVLYWQYADTSAIDGFIIKRIIYDGTGVLDSTLNNIAILPNNVLSFTDTSTAFQTQANPNIRSEKYAISAYYLRNDSTFYSNITPLQNTIFLQAVWDYCNQKAFFKWSKYQNRNIKLYNLYYSFDKINYSLLYSSATDTSYQTRSLQVNKDYYFKIETVIDDNGQCCCDTSVSNLAHIFTASAVAPNKFLCKYATVIDNKINVLLESDSIYGISKLNIYRDGQAVSEIKFYTDVVFKDDSAKTDEIHDYYFVAEDSCGNTIVKSNTVSNLRLEVSQTNDKFFFQFNKVKINNQPADYYELQYFLDNMWQTLQFNMDSTYSVEKRELYSRLNAPDSLKTLIFRLIAYKNNEIVYSNIVHLPVMGYLVVPNTFFPKGNNPQDKFFSVKAHFISKFRIVIFNTDNQVVFTSDNVDFQWDGKFKGKNLPSGYYLYRIEYTSTTGIKGKINGGIFLSD